MSVSKTLVHIGWFFVYLITSWFFLVQLFRLAARHKYYFHLVPFVVGYAVLVAVLLRYLGFQDFFWWYLAPSSAFFLANISRHLKSKDALDAFARLETTVLDSLPDGEIKQQVQKELAPDRAITQHIVAAVVVFVVSFVLAFYLCNGGI